MSTIISQDGTHIVYDHLGKGHKGKLLELAAEESHRCIEAVVL